MKKKLDEPILEEKANAEMREKIWRKLGRNE